MAGLLRRPRCSGVVFDGHEGKMTTGLSATGQLACAISMQVPQFDNLTATRRYRRRHRSTDHLDE